MSSKNNWFKKELDIVQNFFLWKALQPSCTGQQALLFPIDKWWLAFELEVNEETAIIYLQVNVVCCEKRWGFLLVIFKVGLPHQYEGKTLFVVFYQQGMWAGIGKNQVMRPK